MLGLPAAFLRKALPLPRNPPPLSQQLSELSLFSWRRVQTLVRVLASGLQIIPQLIYSLKFQELVRGFNDSLITCRSNPIHFPLLSRILCSMPHYELFAYPGGTSISSIYFKSHFLQRCLFKNGLSHKQKALTMGGLMTVYSSKFLAELKGAYVGQSFSLCCLSAPPSLKSIASPFTFFNRL